MDKDLHDLEEELKRLRPAALSPNLLARIAHELDQAPMDPTGSRADTVRFDATTAAGGGASGDGQRRSASMRWWWTIALPAAAAVAVGIFPFAMKRASVPQQVASVATDADASPISANWLTATKREAAESARVTEGATLKPVAAENLLVGARDEGLVTLDDGTPARRERLQYVDTITWQNPRTHASLTWRVPREEVRVVPVLFQ